MCTTIETIGECLGKPVVDPYGRRLGYIVSYYSDADGRIKGLEININDVEYREVSIERIQVGQSGIILIPEYEYDAIVVKTV